LADRSESHYSNHKHSSSYQTSLSIHFKIATLTYCVLQSGSPSYLSSLINLNNPPRLPHSVCYMFLSPPRPSVAKPSDSQLLRFGTLFHKISGYYHPLALSNAVSKLTFFPTPASHVPTLLYASASDLSSLEFVRYINSVMIIIIIIIVNQQQFLQRRRMFSNTIRPMTMSGSNSIVLPNYIPVHDKPIFHLQLAVPTHTRYPVHDSPSPAGFPQVTVEIPHAKFPCRSLTRI